MDHKGHAQLEKAKKVVAVLYNEVHSERRARLPITQLAVMLRESDRWRTSVAEAAGVTPLSDETVELAVDLVEWVETLPRIDSSWDIPE